MPLGISKLRGPWVILGAAFCLFWPIWLPFAVKSKWEAYRAKPLYLEAVRELSNLVRQQDVLTKSINKLMERLAAERDELAAVLITQELSRELEDIKSLQATALPQARRRAADIRCPHSAFFDADPEMPERSVCHQGTFGGLPNDSCVSQLGLSVCVEGDKPSQLSVAKVAHALRQHLYGGTMFVTWVDESRTAIRGPGWTLFLSSTFKKSFKKLGTELRRRASEAIAELLVDPMKQRGRTVACVSDAAGMWSYRIADYELTYLPRPRDQQIVILGLLSRERRAIRNPPQKH